MENPRPTIAYFSMEIGVRPEMPAYAGALGMLAGDTLLHRTGYFYQRMDASGRQTEERAHWVVEDFLIGQGSTRLGLD